MIEYFERGATQNALLFFGAGIAPHGSTNRFSYTVPTGKFAKILSGEVFLIRDAVATVVGGVAARILMTLSGNTSYLLYSGIMNVAVGSSDSQNTGESGVLQSGDTIVGNTVDASPDGTINYRVSATLTEFA